MENRTKITPFFWWGPWNFYQRAFGRHFLLGHLNRERDRSGLQCDVDLKVRIDMKSEVHRHELSLQDSNTGCGFVETVRQFAFEDEWFDDAEPKVTPVIQREAEEKLWASRAVLRQKFLADGGG